jgi:tetratricopeptide (TPR) repeat protein
LEAPARSGLRLARAAALLAATLLPSPTQGQEPRVGTVDFPNSGAREAQESFLFGVAQLHNFQYASAAEAFRRAQDVDPDFALAYWGEAMTHNHTVWEEQDRDAALAALRRLGPTPEERVTRAPTQRERDLLSALEVLYGEGSKEDRDDAYARAMQELHERYPEDPEVASFTALAILGTAHEGRDFATYMRAAAIVEDVFAEHPDHPGAAHYLIHSYDDPVHAPLGLRAARAYSVIAPDAAHAQHMVSHIFVASGMWEEVVEANLNSVAAGNRARGIDSREPRGCGHATTWLNYGYLQLGRTDDAARITATCHARAVAEVDPEPAFDPDLSSQASFITMWARYAVDTEDFDSPTVRLSVPLASEQWQERMTVAFVHGLAAARAGRADGVRGALEVIRETRGGTERMAADSDRTFELEATARSAVLESQMEALLAQAEGRTDDAIAHARAAAEREERMPFMFGPPFVDKPSHELLGEILLAAGRADEAVEAYRVALSRAPGRVMSVEGLARASQRGRDEQ